MTQTATPTRPVWQYNSIVEDDNLALNKALGLLGKQGWEAYAIVRKEYKSGKDVYIAYLKRQA